jgi:hypothetical protein
MSAGHGSRAVALGRSDRGFESHSGHGYLLGICVVCCVCAALCLGRGLATS